MQDTTPRADSDEPKEPPRLSPNSLERRFLAELHQLDSMEMSMKQLTGVERTRAVSMAQQESVSLAQMLKVKENQWAQMFASCRYFYPFVTSNRMVTFSL